MKLAAIDIGSNAARLLITSVSQNDKGSPVFQKINLIRVPLRLGFDVFENNYISEPKAAMLLSTMLAYKNLLDAYSIPLNRLKAAATSAMRDAENAQTLIEKIRNATGIEVEIISGDAEATLIYENHIAEDLDKDHSYLYIDVGGGSTEVTLFSKGRMIFKRSFNIGTIRILKEQVTEEQWDELKEFIKKETRHYANSVAIGSGGNINKVLSLSKRKEGKPLPLDLLKDFYKELSDLSVPERMSKFEIREDRADVIVPALQIYINIMRWSDIEEIHVPKIGLADGLIHHLYEELAGVPDNGEAYPKQAAALYK
jgi:exopolyphosphatase/guanosine-5'-triphosphate,3'-diphosphate pyrophosphatase